VGGGALPNASDSTRQQTTKHGIAWLNPKPLNPKPPEEGLTHHKDKKEPAVLWMVL
jgi:hypothetical protein